MNRQPYLDPYLVHNSALACFLLAEATCQYQKLTDSPLPLSKALLILPVLWHTTSCQIVSTRQFASTLSNVLAQNPAVRIGFRRRMQAFAPPTLQGLNLAAASNLVEPLFADSDTYLSAAAILPAKRVVKDVPAAMNHALARLIPWLASHPSPTLYHLFLKD